MRIFNPALIAAWLIPGSFPVRPASWEKSGGWPAPEAKQAAAADGRFLYAVTNKLVAKYDRETGNRATVRLCSVSRFRA